MNIKTIIHTIYNKLYAIRHTPYAKLGFTLIELLIVIAIVGILTALVTTNLQGARERARDTRRKSDLRAIEQSLRLYYNDNKSFPSDDGSDAILGCDGGTTCQWGSGFVNGTTTYMASLPTDPSSSGASPITYRYISSGEDSYVIVASLENESDLDIADSQARCASLYSSSNPANDYVVCVQ